MLKALLRRLRGYLQAEVMAELAAIRAELARRDQVAEAALLTIALNHDEAAGPQGEVKSSSAF